MRRCLTLVVAIALVQTTVAINQAQDQGVMGQGSSVGSIIDIFNPLGVGSKQQFRAEFTEEALDVPVPIKDQETVFKDEQDYTAMCASGVKPTVPLDTILRPISTDPPPGNFKGHAHVVKPMRIRPRDRARPLPTNKFYGNLMLGDSHAPIWTHPYGLRWDNNGLSISHIDDNMKVLGPEQMISQESRGGGYTRPGTSKYYINPFLISMGLSATEFDDQHDMTVGDFGEFGCMMVLSPASERWKGALENPKACIRVPIVRGMAFITGVYQDLTPRIFSSILVRTLTRDPNPRTDGWVKYKFLIENGITWLLYAKPDRPHVPALDLKMVNQGQIVSTSGKFTGLIQIAKLPVGREAEAESIYDSSVGVYATGGELAVRQKYFDG